MADICKKLDTKSKVAIALIFLTLFCSFPYTFPRFFPTPGLTVMIVLEMVVLFFINLKIKVHSPLPNSLLIICIFQIVVFVFLAVFHSDLFYLMRFALYVVLTYFSLYVIHNCMGISKFITINNLWLVIQTVLGVIGFILIITNIISPLMVYYFEDTFGEDYFYGITTTNAIIGIIPRIAGYFDEPGAFAQWGMFALVLNKISPQYSKKIEMLLIFGLIFTFSLAFFLQLAIYFVVFNFSRLKRFIPLIIVFAGVSFAAVKFIPEDSDLYILTLRRFDTKAENNRDESSEIAKKLFYQNPVMGKGYTKLVDSGVYFYDNPYETLASSGILGTFALYLPLLFILLKYRKNGGWQAVVVLAVGYLQRPFHIQYIHYLMLYLLFLSCCFNNRKQLTMEDN